MLVALLLPAILTLSPGPTFRLQDAPKQEAPKQEEPKKEIPQPKQDDPIPPTDPKHAADLERDVKNGKKYAEEVEKKDVKLSDKPEYQERVNRVAEQLIPVANKNKVKVTWGDARLNPFKYTFKVIEGKDINAFSLPGGFIYVNEGLLDYVESDDELASVIAHEIAHASLRHVATMEREYSKMNLITLPAILVAILTKSSEAIQLTQLWNMAKGSGWSIQAEEAADYAGLQYMQKSKYNPVAILTFMERLAKDKRYLDPLERKQGILQTHPISRERAETIARELQEAQVPIHRSKASKAFSVEIKPGDKGVEAWFNKRLLYTFGGSEALRRATDAKDKLDPFFDRVPELYDVQVRDGQVLGQRKLLFEIESEDAAAWGVGKDELESKALLSIRQSLYNLAYRVWDTQ